MTDRHPKPWESLSDYVNRVICGRPAPREHHAEWPGPQPRYFEPSWVTSPASARQMVNYLIQSRS